MTVTSQRYCAFLRGVNVNGTSMKMIDVCQTFKNAGMQDVSSVLATGNILFSSDVKENELREILEKAMSERFSYEAFLFVKNKEQVNNIIMNNPFEKAENYHIYGFVGTNEIHKILMEEFEKSTKSQNEKAAIVDQQFYWQVEKGNTLDSSFGKILGRKQLKDQFTSRNINTFEKIMVKF